jgi:endoglycosylceramidase
MARAAPRRHRLRRLLLGALAALVILVGGGLLAGLPAPQTSRVPGPDRPGDSQGWLGVGGGRILDDQGRALQLRGFNDTALLEWSNGEWVGETPLDDADADLMRRAGMDVVRLPISWALLEPQRHHVEASYLDRMQSDVRLLERHGLRVVLDMHFGIGWGPRSEIPAWANLPVVPSWRPIPNPPWNQSIDPQVAADEAYFWTTDDWQRDLAESWRAVAARFHDDPMLVGYDLYNEPHPVPIPPGIFENRFMWPAYTRLVSRIAAVDPNHLFILEGTLADELPTATEPVQVPGLVYSAHLYAGSIFELPLQGEAQAIDSGVRERAREAAALGAPLWIGELGISNTAPDANLYARQALAQMDRVGAVGWAWWQWRSDDRWSVRSRDGRRLDLTALGRVAQPYLRAAPAGMTATLGGGGRELDVQAAAGHAGTPAEVAWPELLLGVPRAEGSCLSSATWSDASSSLSLAVTPGAGCTIRVTPA